MPFLANLFQWSAQVALVTIAGAAIMRLVRVEAPALRHTFWRALLLACLALPLVQPWPPSPPASAVNPDATLAAELAAPSAPGVAPVSPSAFAMLRRAVVRRWPVWIGFVLAAGAVVRLIWLAAGLLRLRRLCKLGEPAAPDGTYDDLAARIQARADVRYVSRIGQPVTFGVFSPVVLLPESFSTLDGTLQRAVLAHELWHVRRRDWAWVLAEESIRAVLWFHPAIWWLVSKVQSTREELVDELTVQLTSARKAYLEALLTFADEPTLFPAAPFARRRHLLDRMLLISGEAVMSSRRIVTSFLAAAAVVVTTGWYGASAFPLRAAAVAAVVPAQAQSPQRDRRPGEPGPETAKEIELKRAIESGTATSDQYLQLGVMQESRGAAREADAVWTMMRRKFANEPAVLTMLARTLVWAGRFDDAASAMEEAASLDPSSAQMQQMLATFYWEKAYKDKALAPTQAAEYIRAGIAATDKALAIDPDYVEALTYKNILLRLQANQETDAAKRQALVAEADTVRNRAMELNRARQASGMSGGVGGGVPGGVAGGVAGGVSGRMGSMPPPPPPPPPPPGAEATTAYSAQQGFLVDGQAPIRVGGNINPPTKIKDVKPVYPPVALEANVQGVVILEAVVNGEGDVVNAKVLRGVPLLDAAAIDAVQQWRFTPTLLNGAPVPVIMTVTVNFTRQQ